MRRNRTESCAAYAAHALLVLLLAPPPARLPAAEVAAFEGEIELPTYPWDPPVRHPYFRELDGRNIYPYPMLDNLSRSKEPRRWKTVVLENEHLRVTFLPELGGRVYEVLDKNTSRPVFYTNHVVKPGLIGQCGAWISGGIEFNTGPAGHTVSAVQPVDVEILPLARDGSRSVAVGEVERIYRTRWTVVVTLRPGRSFLEETIRIYNRTETVRPYYFWNCTAVPNAPGFRFVYPMTLGTDHAGTTFYTWPIFEGKDLSLARNYEDAASIFAWGCDQDFFGSYDEDADRGVVAWADHRVLPGKKAWTWGQGGYGRMHQMDLTDDDGPYNEVQTGPLLTQADVGRLDPHETIGWKEWWYPVHGIGGFTYATKDLAANAARDGRRLRLRLIGTGERPDVEVRARAGAEERAARTRLSPARPSEVSIAFETEEAPARVEVRAGSEVLARFSVPLEVPLRTPPPKAPRGERAGDLASAPDAARARDCGEARDLARRGWEEYLFARLRSAEDSLRKALEKDPSSAEAHAALAFVRLDADPEEAAREARAALEVDPDRGLARHALAVAERRLGREDAALDEAFRASLDPGVAAAARALAAKILIGRGEFARAALALSDPGPWTSDLEASNLLAFALLRSGETRRAARIAARNLDADPLDAFARSVLWLLGEERDGLPLARLVAGKDQAVLELAAAYADLGQDAVALRVLEEFGGGAASRNPLLAYWGAYLAARADSGAEAARRIEAAKGLSAEGVFPHRTETVPVLRWALERDPSDGKAALLLGHLLASLGRYREARGAWRRALERGESPAVAARALAMAALKLDGDRDSAERLFGRALAADPKDAIVAMDLARLRFEAAERAGGDARKREIVASIRDLLLGALEAGRGRSDFVALLARAHSRLGEHALTARLLDSVRITIWEGAREVHDLFEEAHLELGKAHLEAGRAEEALAEFDRALEYPENLATGRLEGAREAHIHYLRGNALRALGRTGEAREAWRRAAEEAPSKDPAKEEARRLAREALERSGA